MNYRLPFSEIKIVSQDEAERAVYKEPNEWNVVSIWSGGGGKHGDDKPKLEKAKTIYKIRFHDIDRQEPGGMILCNEDHIKGILNFAKKIPEGEKLLVHCAAGISRSTAITFLIILDRIKRTSEWPVEDAISIVHKIRPIAYPNRHILHLGIIMLAPNLEIQIRWFRELYNSDTFRRIYG